MSDPYIGEIRLFGGNFAPAGWALCDGQLMAISENEALFQLIGTTYGGDGQSTFALPDLRGRVPVHMSSSMPLGEPGGVEAVTLTTSTIASHGHTLVALNAFGNDPNPENNSLAESSIVSMYQAAAPSVPMAPQSLGPVGGSQPHENLQPFTCVNFILSLYGIYPPPN